MKKVLSIMLTAIMALSLFGGITAVAEELSFALPSANFDIDGFEYGVDSKSIQISTSSYYAIDELEFWVEDDNGKPVEVVGVSTRFSIVVKFTPKNHYDFSLLSKENVSSDFGYAYEFYEESGYYYAKFERDGFMQPYDKVNFILQGYEVGNAPEDLTAFSDIKGVEVLAVDIFDVTDYFNGIKEEHPLKLVEKIEAERKYYVGISFFLPEGYTVENMPYESKTLEVNSEVVLPHNNYHAEYTDASGRLVFMIGFTVSEITEEVAGDLDGDGVVTVSDALSALRTASGMGDDVAAYTLKRAAVEPVKGDMDGDGKVTVADALAILRIAAGL